MTRIKEIRMLRLSGEKFFKGRNEKMENEKKLEKMNGTLAGHQRSNEAPEQQQEQHEQRTGSM